MSLLLYPRRLNENIDQGYRQCLWSIPGSLTLYESVLLVLRIVYHDIVAAHIRYLSVVDGQHRWVNLRIHTIELSKFTYIDD